jgi:pyridoxal phosphate-dependent aminotransferase EpsN
MARTWLSVPHMGERELELVRRAFEQNWLSTVGPNLDDFEAAFTAKLARPSVALASGTAAVHLGLRLLGVAPGDEVFSPTLTFVGSVNPISWLGARPVFLDSDRASWNLDPALLEDALRDRAERRTLPKAVIVVHLYGQSADMDPILALCNKYEIPVLEDAAEALGALYKGKPVGTFAPVSAFSFNGNKIITTTGGGMLIARDRAWVERARFWSTQARDPGIAYQHTEMGYNYRMSNVLAGIGIGQLEVLDLRVTQRRNVAARYWKAFEDVRGISPMPQASWGLHTNWLSCFLIDEGALGIGRDDIIRALAAEDIEARPVWKPMHLQPLFASAARYGGAVAEDLFQRGICLPSSSSLTEQDQRRVIDIVRVAARHPPLPPIS